MDLQKKEIHPLRNEAVFSNKSNAFRRLKKHSSSPPPNLFLPYSPFTRLTLHTAPRIQCANEASIIKVLFLVHCTPAMFFNFTPIIFFNARFLVTADYEFYSFYRSFSRDVITF